MQKKDNKGFMLVETLIVSTFIAGVLIFLFIQFSNLSTNFEKSFKYNTVEKIYALQDIADAVIKDSTYMELFTALDSDKKRNIDLTNYYTKNTYAQAMLDFYEIKTLYLTHENISTLDTSSYSLAMKEFVDKITYDRNGSGRRLIAEFNDGMFATIII